MNKKEKDKGKIIKKLKVLDKEDFYFIGAKLKCPHCKNEFGIDKNYIGVITCPYCGKYVEG
jgi:ribosomal protein S27E